MRTSSRIVSATALTWLLLTAGLIGCGPTENVPDDVSDTTTDSGGSLCLDDNDCVIASKQFYCQVSDGVCLECLTDTNCKKNGPAGAVCHPTRFECVGCTDDVHCKPGVCVAEGLYCVECLDDSHCKSGKCDEENRICIGCGTDKECNDGNPCTTDYCADKVCINKNHPDGEVCNAGPCTLDDQCKDGQCIAGAPDPACDACESDGDCDDGQWCSQDVGACKKKGEADGLCADKPVKCAKDGTPVCGCDGQSYENKCLAEQLGVNVLHKGLCCQPFKCAGAQNAIDTDKDGCVDACPCEDHSLCGVFEYCERTTCEDLSGLCRSCKDSPKDFCACDGTTYTDGCQAKKYKAKVSLKPPELSSKCCELLECAPGSAAVDVDNDGCNDVCECKTSSNCGNQEVCITDACGTLGYCKPCSKAAVKVCGCDGDTYGSTCDAAKADTSLGPGLACSCEPIKCVNGTEPVDTTGDKCLDSCVNTCKNSCDCYDKSKDPPKAMCADTCEACGAFWVCDKGLCTAKCDELKLVSEKCFQDKDCKETSDCSPGTYCAKLIGGCDDAKGKCAVIPTQCAEFMLAASVCGCDNTTYKTECEAAKAGWSLKTLKACTK